MSVTPDPLSTSFVPLTAKSTSPPTSSPVDNISDLTPTTPSAARRVYDIPEVRLMILKVLALGDLAVMIRVEAQMLEDVARLMYGVIGTDVAFRLDRKTTRNIAYSDAVSTLDLSPLPLTHTSILADSRGPTKQLKRAAKRVDFTTQLTEVTKWRARLQRLECMERMYPDHLSGDDAWAVYINKATGAIERFSVESVVIIDVNVNPFVPPTFPPSPTHEGFAVVQTFIIRLIEEAAWGGSVRERVRQLKAIKSWLYSNPSLDKRVTGVDHGSARLKHWERMSVEEAITFAEDRSREGCLPLTRFCVDSQDQPASLHDLATLLNALGPQIRVIHLDDTGFGGFDHWREAITLLDDKLPNLAEAVFGFNLDGRDPEAMRRLKGLVGLRRLCVAGLGRASWEDRADLISGLGSVRCVYQDTSILKAPATKRFHETVSKTKIDNIRRIRAKAAGRC